MTGQAHERRELLPRVAWKFCNRMQPLVGGNHRTAAYRHHGQENNWCSLRILDQRME